MSRVVKVEPLTTARALRGPFDYRAPEGAVVGTRLVVPFGHRDVPAVVTGLADDSEHDVVDVRKVVEPALPPELVDLAFWIADEYCSTPARALQLMLPPGGARAKTALYAEATDAARDPEVRLTGAQRALLDSLPRFTGGDTAALRRLEGRGLVAIVPRVVRRVPLQVSVGAVRERPRPTVAQQAAIDRLTAAGPGEQLLLHGVTGSGKTEVYLQAAERTLAAGRSVLVLVPEIGLTPQIVARFAERFGDTVAVLHSQLSAGERLDEWMRLHRGEARVCVGPRSAVFAPLRDLGLVIVDEEHDSSYKHEGDPRYDARGVAAQRAAAAGAVLVVGSATPRPESINAIPRLQLAERVDGQGMPPVRIVDMRSAPNALHPDTHAALMGARKAIVLLNRRGWSNFLNCQTCGHAWECPQCDVTLVLHAAQREMACHHCGHREPVPRRCPTCGGVSIARHGTGTERLADDLAQAGVPVFRLDADVGRGAQVLAAFGRAERGILVGTQMVAKGHDFPDVDLGVVVDADSTLRFPDFRAEERTFALVTQLAGRAGRGHAGGRVLVQTLDPEAESLRFAAQHDSDGFLRAELGRRRALRYPPFATLIRVVCGAEAPGAALRTATTIATGLREGEPDSGAGAQILGPARLFRLRGRERAQLVVKASDRTAAIALVRGVVDGVAGGREHRGVALSVDVDPQ
ncbi:primosomal protein N' [Paraconexibacter antarcticus]|uniref:Replication restart protein PriA n=1 Tax=Paraconexibacter antarcticus TaxID=2949664 RepID=A0ABY5DQE4_9ACTN|nr:primosomal protein N' [Paraconexibacter antarcticus]UTI63134.1 primosomal protein N' [Paraconexibacter antarcticus]